MPRGDVPLRPVAADRHAGPKSAGGRAAAERGGSRRGPPSRCRVLPADGGTGRPPDRANRTARTTAETGSSPRPTEARRHDGGCAAGRPSSADPVWYRRAADHDDFGGAGATRSTSVNSALTRSATQRDASRAGAGAVRRVDPALGPGRITAIPSTRERALRGRDRSRSPAVLPSPLWTSNPPRARSCCT